MKKKTKKIEGKCAECGSDNIEYGVMYPDSAGVVYPYTCNECNHNGEEFYSITFVSNT